MSNVSEYLGPVQKLFLDELAANKRGPKILGSFALTMLLVIATDTPGHSAWRRLLEEPLFTLLDIETGAASAMNAFHVVVASLFAFCVGHAFSRLQSVVFSKLFRASRFKDLVRDALAKAKALAIPTSAKDQALREAEKMLDVLQGQLRALRGGSELAAILAVGTASLLIVSASCFDVIISAFWLLLLIGLQHRALIVSVSLIAPAFRIAALTGREVNWDELSA